MADRLSKGPMKTRCHAPVSVLISSTAASRPKSANSPRRRSASEDALNEPAWRTYCVYLDSLGVEPDAGLTVNDSSSSVVKKVKLGCLLPSSLSEAVAVIVCGKAVGFIPAMMPKLAMTPTTNPTIKPLTCDPLNNGVSGVPGFFCPLLRRVALVAVERLRLLFCCVVGTVYIPYHMASGADTPRIYKPLAITCFAAAASDNLARLTDKSSSMILCWL